MKSFPRYFVRPLLITFYRSYQQILPHPSWETPWLGRTYLFSPHTLLLRLPQSIQEPHNQPPPGTCCVCASLSTPAVETLFMTSHVLNFQHLPRWNVAALVSGVSVSHGLPLVEAKRHSVTLSNARDSSWIRTKNANVEKWANGRSEEKIQMVGGVGKYVLVDPNWKQWTIKQKILKVPCFAKLSLALLGFFFGFVFPECYQCEIQKQIHPFPLFFCSNFQKVH